MEFEFLLPLIPLYAETHFRFFPCFPSALYRRRPEVVFDIPFRIESNVLPLCLTIHDIARYPAKLKSVTATVSSFGRTFPLAEIRQCERHRLTHGLSENTDGYLFSFQLPREIEPGPFYINAFADLTSVCPKTLENGHRVPIAISGRCPFSARNGEFISTSLDERGGGEQALTSGELPGSWKVFNDNLPTSSKRALVGRYSAEKFPGHDRCVFGDIHMHSQYSESHVEFGPPVETISRTAGAAGLDFVGITDHSYDLACRVNDYLKADPHGERWNLLKRESEHQYADGATILAGEEVSTLNSHGKVVHLGGLGFPDFIPGSLDGARHNRLKDKQLSTHEVASEISRQGGVSFAAHPGAHPGILQKLLLRRGIWSEADLSPHLHGLQGANGDFDAAWERSRRLWIKSLLNGRRYCLLAGSDAHGDFSRYRSVGIPFVSINENFNRHMGYTRTGVYTKTRNRDGISDGIRAGKTFVTSGPFLSIDMNGRSVVGERFSCPPENLSVTILGSKEFGNPVRIRVYRGLRGEENERIIADHTWDPTKPERREALMFSEHVKEGGYIRAEGVSRDSEGNIFKAYTSAVFFEDP